MNQRMVEELARQRQAEVQRLGAGRECGSLAAAGPAGYARARTGPARRRRGGSAGRVSAGTSRRDASKSLRARTGWWLVDVGLKLAVTQASRSAASPRPVRS